MRRALRGAGPVRALVHLIDPARHPNTREFVALDGDQDPDVVNFLTGPGERQIIAPGLTSVARGLDQIHFIPEVPMLDLGLNLSLGLGLFGSSWWWWRGFRRCW